MIYSLNALLLVDYGLLSQRPFAIIKIIMDYFLYTYIALAVAFLSFILLLILLFQGHKSKIQELPQLINKIEEIEKIILEIKKSDNKSLKGVCFTRFTPFTESIEGYGCSLGTLNKEGDGFLITSLTSREGSRIYIKEVISGKPQTSLSKEEEEILKEAWKKARNG